MNGWMMWDTVNYKPLFNDASIKQTEKGSEAGYKLGASDLHIDAYFLKKK